MKPEDIIVGKRYVHAETIGDVWLGVGRRKLFTDNEIIPETKTLVLIESNDPQYIGRMAQQGEDVREGWWEMIQEESENNFFIMREKLI